MEFILPFSESLSHEVIRRIEDHESWVTDRLRKFEFRCDDRLDTPESIEVLVGNTRQESNIRRDKFTELTDISTSIGTHLDDEYLMLRSQFLFYRISHSERCILVPLSREDIVFFREYGFEDLLLGCLSIASGDPDDSEILSRGLEFLPRMCDDSPLENHIHRREKSFRYDEDEWEEKDWNDYWEKKGNQSHREIYRENNSQNKYDTEDKECSSFHRPDKLLSIASPYPILWMCIDEGEKSPSIIELELICSEEVEHVSGEKLL